MMSKIEKIFEIGEVRFMGMSYENATDASVLAGFRIDDFISHHERVFWVNMVFGNKLLNHLT
jgi:hypothetical protein